MLASRRESVSLTVEGETPSWRAASRNPPARTMARKTESSSREAGVLFDMPISLFGIGRIINVRLRRYLDRRKGDSQ